MHIGGTNWQLGKIRGDGSYYFSLIPHVWGWATWKRAWKRFSLEPLKLEEAEIVFKKKYSRYWFELSNNIEKKHINSWDYYWAFSLWRNEGICITPNQNLVKNIGFDSDATHTKSPINNYSSIGLEFVPMPLRHPETQEIEVDADEFTFVNYYEPRVSFANRLLHSLLSLKRYV